MKSIRAKTQKSNRPLKAPTLHRPRDRVGPVPRVDMLGLGGGVGYICVSSVRAPMYSTPHAVPVVSLCCGVILHQSSNERGPYTAIDPSSRLGECWGMQGQLLFVCLVSRFSKVDHFLSFQFTLLCSQQSLPRFLSDKFCAVGCTILHFGTLYLTSPGSWSSSRLISLPRATGYRQHNTSSIDIVRRLPPRVACLSLTCCNGKESLTASYDCINLFVSFI